MALDHPYLRLPIPSDAPFELKPSPGRGWGAYATRRIERGALIFSEEPLFVIRKPHAEISDQDVATAVQRLPASRKPLFFLLRDNASGEFRSLNHAMAENSFNMAGEDHGGRQLDGPRGLFPLHSRFNHSCRPNAKIPSGGATEIPHVRSFATRDILPGEEITIEYEGDFACRTREERHRALRFVCNCDVCRPGNPLGQLSDLRRRLIRGLQYLETGSDLDRRDREALCPRVITDPQLQGAALTFSIPLSSRLIYGLLRMFLIEQEGLMDDLLEERLSSSILATVAAFQTESNARIAKLAMAQRTWFERMYLAFQLYGRADAGDEAVAEILRMLHGRT